MPPSFFMSVYQRDEMLPQDLLFQEEISYDIKKFPITGRNVLSMEEISSDRNREKEIPGHIKKFPVAG